uniref:Uncharacterized protein n=1 Tax=Rhizophora mucronata TaxID=61149 RepID=A0A2P2J7N9_RHIMU
MDSSVAFMLELRVHVNWVLSYLSFYYYPLLLTFLFLLFCFHFSALLDLVRPFLDLVRPRSVFLPSILCVFRNFISESWDIKLEYFLVLFPLNSSSSSLSIPPELFELDCERPSKLESPNDEAFP